MFAKVTRHLVRETDPDGSLLPVTRLTDSDKFQPLGVVLKSQRRWPWQRAKYRATDFNLTQITQGRHTLRPVLLKSDFLNYEGTYAGTLSGTLSADVGRLNVKAEGQGSSKLHSSLGRLHKEAVDVNRLMKDSKDRVVDVRHPFVQQSLCKRKVITVVKERIFTSKSCSVWYHGLGSGSCGALLGILRKPPLKVSVSENATLQMDSEVSMEIPAKTVLAYSVIELKIKKNGQYGFCFQADVEGGFDWDVGKIEDDSGECVVDGHLEEPNTRITAGESPSIQNTYEELANLKEDLGRLSELDAATRSSLLSLLVASLLDEDFLSLLEDWLDDWCSGEVADMAGCQDQRVQAILNLLFSVASQDSTHPGLPSPNGNQATLPDKEARSNQLSAATEKRADGQLIGQSLHLLVSAFLELTSDCLNLIKSCWSEGLVPSLSQLVDGLLKSQCLPLDAVPPLLQDEKALHTLGSLLHSAGLQLGRQAGELLLEVKETAGFKPLTLGIVLQGLACLSLKKYST